MAVMATRRLSMCLLLFFISCFSVLLLTTFRRWSYWDIRHDHLLSFISRRASPFHFLSWISEDKTVLSSSATTNDLHLYEFSNKNHDSRRINESLPWIHFHASSTKILENYFFHGYYQRGDKYHKKFTHSRLAILPFIFDKDDRLKRCVSQVSLQQEMAVKHHSTMLSRWQWESSTEGLASFKSKYKVFYGPASHGACFQTFFKGYSAQGVKINSENVSALNDKNSTVGTDFVQDTRNDQYWTDGLDRSNCGQILLLQHPISRSIEEYRKTVLRQTSCTDKYSFRKSINSDADCVVNKEDDEDRLVDWIKNRGNVIFRHILFHPEICKGGFFLKPTTQNESSFVIQEKNQTIIYSNNNINSTENIFSFGNMSDLDNATDINHKHHLASSSTRNGINSINDESQCDRNVRVFLQDLDLNERSYLLSYVVKKLPSLFSVVALYEDLEKSLEMLDIVHHFPLRECISQQQRGAFKSNSDSSVKNNRHLASSQNQAYHYYQDNKNAVVPQDFNQDMAEKFQFDSDILRPRQTSEAHEKAPQGHYEIFQDLKDDNHTDSNEREKGVILSEQSAENNFFNNPIKDIEDNKSGENQPLIDNLVKKDNTIEKYKSMPTRSKPYSQIHHISNSNCGCRLKVCNEVPDFHHLFQRLSSNEIVQKSLDLDLQIYNEVKKLYKIQKRMVFNTLKT